MSKEKKVKLLIEIPEEDYKFIKDLQSLIIGGRGNCKTIQQNVINAIRSGTPYNPTGDLISRKALKEELELSKYIVPNDLNRLLNSEINRCIEAVDYAPIVEFPLVEFPPVINMKPLTAEEKQGLIDALKKSRLKVVKLDDEGIRGECRTCRHRDPEDKKCDCGAQERQGCPFPVSDDYYCKFYEKGGAE